MKDYLLELVSKQTGYNAKLNIMREYLQAYALRALHEEGLFRRTAFLGGTALRFLYNLPRFSEDLDFSIAREDKDYSFVGLMTKLKEVFLLANYNISVSYNDKKPVQHAFLRFQALMYEVKLSPLKDQKFSIKIEIDTNPPCGALLQTRIVNKYFPMSFLSYDVPSLFAGKLHAIFSRKFTKSRDFFDLGWYLSKWKELSPNIELLKNALEQTGWKKAPPTSKTWRQYLYETVEKTDWKNVRKDIENFLENKSDLEVFSKENVLRLIKGD